MTRCFPRSFGRVARLGSGVCLPLVVSVLLAVGVPQPSLAEDSHALEGPPSDDRTSASAPAADSHTPSSTPSPTPSSTPSPSPSPSPSRSPAGTPVTEEDRARLADLAAEVTRFEDDAKAFDAKVELYERTATGAAAMLDQIAADIREIKARKLTLALNGETVEEIETALLGAEQDLKLARQTAAELAAEQSGRPDRRRQLPELLIAAKQRLLAKGDPLPAAPREPALERAAREVDGAERASLEASVRAFGAELGTFEVRGQLLGRRLDRASSRVAFHEAQREALQAALTARAEADANAEAARAEESRAEVEALPDPARAYARALAERNAVLAGERTGSDGLRSKIDDLRERLSRADEGVAQLDEDLQRLTRKVEAVGLSDAVGQLLRKQRSATPDVGKYRRFIRMREELISQVQIELIERREERRAIADVDEVLARAMVLLDDSVDPGDRRAIESVLRDLLETKQTYLDALISDHETYFEHLVDFDSRQRQLIEKTEELLLFIDARVLWIPSIRALRGTLLADGVRAVEWLGSPRLMGQVANAVRGAVSQAPLLALLLALFAALFWPLRSRIKRRIDELGRVAREPTCERVAPTLEATGQSLLLAAWLPCLVGLVGWRLGTSEVATQYVRSVADGLIAAAVFWLSIAVPRQLLRKHGVAEAHLAVPADATKPLRRQLLVLAWVAVPAVFVISAFETRAEDAWRESIGRLGFIVLMLAVMLFTHRALFESRGSLSKIVQSVPELSVRKWVFRVGHGMFVGAAVLLIGVAFRGYYFTALQFAERLHFALLFVFLLGVLFLLFVRFALCARRHVAFDRIRKRVAQQAEAASRGEDVGEITDAEVGVDLGAADTQTVRLLKSAAFVALLAGFWLIFADLFPATGILREVELWETTRSVSLAATNAAGETRFIDQESVVPVTLADLLLSALFAILTMIVVRNLPGVLEITVLARLGAGERYAYASIAKYAVTMLGVVLTFNAIGIGWSSIQWLVAAIGLGLGFGLQEIFANFVSGLIILFERPLRVGDTVTVGDTSGVVSRVRIRATWITGFDRKELVVPNKEFVTNRLINWSLTDQVLRLDIPVGIAYGSDTEKVMRVLHLVAAENRDVLRDPAPDVLFLGFGDSALEFELRVFCPDVARRLRIQHALHMAIDRAFRAEGIEIAFPQRDVHVRSISLPTPIPGV